jgi:CDP-glucose 4,6-dehydratase
MFARDNWKDGTPVARIPLADCRRMSQVIGDYSVDTIFHLAAQTQVGLAKTDPLGTLEANARGTWHILEAARSTRDCQVLLASSGYVYGESAGLPHREEDPLNAAFPYDVSKSCGDLVSRMYAVTYGVPVGILRFANLFGGGDSNLARGIPGMILATLRGEPFVIRGDGQSVRDFLYAEDAAEAFLLLAEKLAAQPELRGESFNFSLECPIAVLKLALLVLGLMGRSELEPIILGDTPVEVRAHYLSAAKARHLLGWRPVTAMEEGLRRTIAWYTANYSRPAGLVEAASAGAKC